MCGIPPPPARPPQVAIFMGKTDPSAPTHQQQSMIIVPMDAPGVKVIRPMMVYGYDDAPHGHAEVTVLRMRDSRGMRDLRGLRKLRGMRKLRVITLPWGRQSIVVLQIYPHYEV